MTLNTIKKQGLSIHLPLNGQPFGIVNEALIYESVCLGPAIYGVGSVSVPE
jgi:hypothetical protein